MSADQDQVFQDAEDQRQREEQADEISKHFAAAHAARTQDEMMAEQNIADLAVMMRVSRGETNHIDFLYLAGRLNINLMEK